MADITTDLKSQQNRLCTRSYCVGDEVRPKMRFLSKFSNTTIEVISVSAGKGSGSWNLVVQQIKEDGTRCADKWEWTIPRKKDSTTSARCDLGGWYYLDKE